MWLTNRKPDTFLSIRAKRGLMRAAHTVSNSFSPMIFLDPIQTCFQRSLAASAWRPSDGLEHSSVTTDMKTRLVLYTFGSIQSPKQQLSGSSETCSCLLYSNIYRIHFGRRKAPETAWGGTAPPPHSCSTWSQTARPMQLCTRQACFNNPACPFGFLFSLSWKSPTVTQPPLLRIATSRHRY